MSNNNSMSTELPAGNYDANELGQYRSLSSLAVISVVFGLASSLMFASQLMLVLPLAAIAIALLAMRNIAVSDGGLSGSRLAILGLALAVFFTVSSYARVQVRESIMGQQVNQTCQEWLNRAALGEVGQMLEMMTPTAAEKLKPTVEVGDPGSFFGGMLNSALMRQSPIVASMSQLQGDGKLSYQIIESEVFATAKPAQAIIRYTIANTSADEQTCSIGLKRARTAGRRQVWLVDSWGLE